MNDPQAVREFQRGERQVSWHRLQAACRPVSGGPPDYSVQLRAAFAGKFSFPPACREEPAGPGCRPVFTRVLTADKLEEIDALAACPAIFQEYVDKQVELRITIVGDKVFTAAIDSQEHAETQVDFRRPSPLPAVQVRHTVFELPPEIRGKLLNLMNRLGLAFGCVGNDSHAGGGFRFSGSKRLRPVGAGSNKARECPSRLRWSSC